MNNLSKVTHSLSKDIHHNNTGSPNMVHHLQDSMDRTHSMAASNNTELHQINITRILNMAVTLLLNSSALHLRMCHTHHHFPVAGPRSGILLGNVGHTWTRIAR